MVAEAEAIVVFVTAPNREEAEELAQLMINEELAACVQILPAMESVYRWQGQIERQSEILLIAKTTKSRFEQLEARVRAVHSYEAPEIVALPIVAGSAAYLNWLKANVMADES